MTLDRQVPLRECPLYLRENSLLPLGPERSHVGERPVDPLTLEAFITSEADFTLKTDDRRLVLRCRRLGRRVTFEATEAPCAYILRVHDCEVPAHVRADGKAAPRLDGQALEAAEAGWMLDGRTLVVKARARQIQGE